jgi:hypothetical protein
MRIIGRTAATLLTTTIVLGASATAANAQATTIKDTASDVVTYSETSGENGTVLGYADSVDSGIDVRSLKVKHTKKSVTFTVKFARLSSNTGVSVAIRPNGKSEPDRVFFNTGRSSGEVYDMSDKTRCTVPVSTKLGKGGSIKATIKRSCLGNPKKIKISAAAVSVDPATGATVYDAVSKSSVRTPSETKWLKAS